MTFEYKKNTALLVGRYQGFHLGHRTLILKALEKVDQVCIGIRDTHGIDEKNPFRFEEIKSRIEIEMNDVIDRITIISLPNITNIFYGRDVGYNIEKIDLPPEIESISATEVRKSIQK